MEHSVNPTNDTQMEKKDNFTSKFLGIADSKEKDLAGYVLSQEELSSAAVKVLIAAGIDKKNIRTIKVGADKEGKLRIIIEIFNRGERKREFFGGIDITEFDDSNDVSKVFNKTFFSMLYNKAYHGKKKHLKIKQVNRKEGKCVQFEFDPTIFIAFVYNISFMDPLYKVSARTIRWKSKKELDRYLEEQSESRNINVYKEKTIYKNQMREYAADGLNNCVVYVTFRDGYRFKGNEGFHPSQVEEWYRSLDSKNE